MTTSRLEPFAVSGWMHSSPEADSLMTAWLLRVMPDHMFMVEATGRSASHGQRVRKPSPRPSTATTLTVAPMAPSGTLPRPVTCSRAVAPDAMRPVVPPRPVRVSSRRAGVSDFTDPEAM